VLIPSHHQRGVSLIELMIGLIIVGILLAKGIPAFSGWIQNTQIRTAAESLQNGLQLARFTALKTNSTVRFNLTSTLTNACALSTTGTNWVISQDDPTSLCATAADNLIAPRIVQTRSNSEGSKNAVITSAQSVIAFNGLGRQISVINTDASVTPNPPVTLTINITNPTNGATCVAQGGEMRCLDIRLSTAGEVRLCDPAFARANNPQGC
jgi:type IV fimbrial biogenesis protein FimT